MRYDHVILDRDGVLNREPDTGWVTDPAAWQWEPGSLDALVDLTRLGAELSVVTNQSCIGRGEATDAAVEAVNRRWRDEAEQSGARVARVIICPHIDEDGCSCRKPRPGMVVRAMQESGCSAQRTVLVGDARRDLMAGRAAGIAVAVVRTGKGAALERELDDLTVPVFDDLAGVAHWIDRPS